MKNILLLIILLLTSCIPNNKHSYEDYNEYVQNKINTMAPPLILKAKHKSFGLYSVSIMDSTKNIEYFGNMSGISNSIGESYMVGDTIIK